MAFPGDAPVITSGGQVGRPFGAGLADALTSSLNPNLSLPRDIPYEIQSHAIALPGAPLPLLLFCLDVSVRSRGRLIPYGDRRAEARQLSGLADHSALGPRRGHLRLLRCDENIVQ